MKDYRFTLFTATYNRKNTLPRLFKSIQCLDYDSFEWLIVDDGSTDGTRELVTQFQNTSEISIRYVWQENAHKKVAWNKGVSLAKGEFFVPIDSDDTLTPDSLKIFESEWLSIPSDDRKDFIGVTCLCRNEQGKIVGDYFPEDRYISDSLKLYFTDKIDGEKFGMSRVDVLKEFPFPEELPDLVPEGLIWFRASEKYKTLFSNQFVRVYFNDVEGLTRIHRAVKFLSRHRRRLGALLSYKEAIEFAEARGVKVSNYRLVIAMIQWWRWSFYCEKDESINFYPDLKTVSIRTIFVLLKYVGRTFFLIDKNMK